MARQTIRTSSLLARDGTNENPTESTKEVDVGEQEERPTEVVQDDLPGDQTEHVATNGSADGAANSNGSAPRRGRRSAGQQPQVGPASPTSSAAKGRAKRAKPEVTLDLTSADREAVGNLAIEAVLRDMALRDLVEEYRAAVNAFDRVIAAAGVK